MTRGLSRTAQLMLGATLVALAPAGVRAQSHHHDHDHGHQAEPAPQEASPTPAPAAPAPPVNASDHSGHAGHSDHAAHGGPAAPPTAAPQTETPPPPSAGSGPPRAADAIWGADAMQASRDALRRHHGDFAVLWVQADRLEWQARDGANGLLWDVQGYYGGPTRRLWFKSEGEGTPGDALESAEFQALLATAIAPFWDLQAGLRQDVAGPDTTHLVIGIQGLAPYQFEVDAAVFISHRGDVTARIEAELDQRVTQRLILQPRVEVNLAAQTIAALGIGRGIDSVEAGLRLRYHLSQEIAPYIGFEQVWRVGPGARIARAAGDAPRSSNFVVGVRFWF